MQGVSKKALQRHKLASWYPKRPLPCKGVSEEVLQWCSLSNLHHEGVNEGILQWHGLVSWDTKQPASSKALSEEVLQWHGWHGLVSWDPKQPAPCKAWREEVGLLQWYGLASRLESNDNEYRILEWAAAPHNTLFRADLGRVFVGGAGAVECGLPLPATTWLL